MLNVVEDFIILENVFWGKRIDFFLKERNIKIE